jgi:hypothetical protein
MTTNDKPATVSYGLLRAAEAVTNWRALAMCGLACVSTLIMGMLTVSMMRHSFFLGFLLGLVTIVVMLIGYSSVGITLMRQAQGQSVGFVEAILQAVFTAHRFLAVGILLFLCYLVVILGALVIFLFCKIPGIGPLLYAFAFPLVALIIGITFTGLGYVGYPLAAPSIWEGNDTFQTMARLMQIGRQRLMSVIVNMFILMILVGFLSLIVFGILGYGSLLSTTLSTVVGVNPMGSLMSLFSGMVGPLLGGFGGFGGGGGGFGGGGFGGGEMEMASNGMAYMSAFGFGVGLLVTIGMVIPFLTFINGTCLIYLQTVNGMDFTASEEKLRERMEEAKRRAAEARDRTAERMREAKASAQAMKTSAPASASAPVAAAAPVVPAAPPAAAQRTCVNCHAPLAADDVFCGECGAKNPL